MMTYIFLLIFAAATWGFGFVAARWAMSSYDPYWVNSLRFALAALLGLPFLIYKKSYLKKDLLKRAMISSVFLLGTLLFQTIGLAYTTVAKSGFITTLYVLFIPLITMVLSQKKYRGTFWVLIFMALMGMALLCNLEIKNLNYGDFLTLLCSISAAMHIMYVGHVSHGVTSPIEFNFLQNVFTAIFSLFVSFVLKGRVDLTPLADFHGLAFKGTFFLAVISSMIAFSIQVIAQRKIPAHIAGLVFLMESPFAALFGFLVFNERLNGLNLMGAVMIMVSVVLVPVLGREVTTLKRAPKQSP